jgi:hypothetical protein
MTRRAPSSKGILYPTRGVPESASRGQSGVNGEDTRSPCLKAESPHVQAVTTFMLTAVRCLLKTTCRGGDGTTFEPL